MKLSAVSDKDKGVYKKFDVKRTDGSSDKGQKHHDCQYFVLDLQHDRFSRNALYAYAKACKKEFPELSKDIFVSLAWESPVSCGCKEAMCPHFRIGPPLKIAPRRRK